MKEEKVNFGHGRIENYWVRKGRRKTHRYGESYGFHCWIQLYPMNDWCQVSWQRSIEQSLTSIWRKDSNCRVNPNPLHRYSKKIGSMVFNLILSFSCGHHWHYFKAMAIETLHLSDWSGLWFSLLSQQYALSRRT